MPDEPKPIDLNALRSTILANQANNTVNPANPSRAIVVDKNAKIHLANEVPTGQEPAVIQQDVFHARVDEERRVVTRFLPTTTRPMVVDGTSGWYFSFVCEFGSRYEMFAYFDGSFYQVNVLSPVVEEKFQSAHTGHIFKDGNICFGANYGSGRPTLEEAYAKSVLWANGFSAMLVAGDDKFPFSLNNQ